MENNDGLKILYNAIAKDLKEYNGFIRQYEMQLEQMQNNRDNIIQRICNVFAPGKLKPAEYDILNEIDYYFFKDNKNRIKQVLLEKFNNDNNEVSKKLNVCSKYLTSSHKAITDYEKTIPAMDNNLMNNLYNIKRCYTFIKNSDESIKQELDAFIKMLSNNDIKSGNTTYTYKDFCFTVFFRDPNIFSVTLDKDIITDLVYINTNFHSKIHYGGNILKLFYLRWVNQYLFDGQDKYDYLNNLLDRQKKQYLINHLGAEQKQYLIGNLGIEGDSIIDDLSFDKLADCLIELRVPGFEDVLIDLDKNFKIDWEDAKSKFNERFDINANIVKLKVNYISQFAIDCDKRNDVEHIKNKIDFFKKDNKIKFYFAEQRRIKKAQNQDTDFFITTLPNDIYKQGVSFKEAIERQNSKEKNNNWVKYVENKNNNKPIEKGINI